MRGSFGASEAASWNAALARRGWSSAASARPSRKMECGVRSSARSSTMACHSLAASSRRPMSRSTNPSSSAASPVGALATSASRRSRAACSRPRAASARASTMIARRRRAGFGRQRLDVGEASFDERTLGGVDRRFRGRRRRRRGSGSRGAAGRGGAGAAPPDGAGCCAAGTGADPSATPTARSHATGRVNHGPPERTRVGRSTPVIGDSLVQPARGRLQKSIAPAMGRRGLCSDALPGDTVWTADCDAARPSARKTAAM